MSSDEKPESKAKAYMAAFVSVLALAVSVVSAASALQSAAAARANAHVASQALALQQDFYSTSLVIRPAMFPGPDRERDPEQLYVTIYNRGMDTTIESIWFKLDMGTNGFQVKELDCLYPWEDRPLKRGESTSFSMSYAYAYWDTSYEYIVGLIVTTAGGDQFEVSLEDTGWYKFDKSDRKRPDSTQRYIAHLKMMGERAKKDAVRLKADVESGRINFGIPVDENSFRFVPDWWPPKNGEIYDPTKQR